jgi:hypothetical protein
MRLASPKVLHHVEADHRRFLVDVTGVDDVVQGHGVNGV